MAMSKKQDILEELQWESTRQAFRNYRLLEDGSHLSIICKAADFYVHVVGEFPKQGTRSNKWQVKRLKAIFSQCVKENSCKTGVTTPTGLWDKFQSHISSICKLVTAA